MNDFLSKLMMRSMERAATVMPRLASRFEGPVASVAPAIREGFSEPDETRFDHSTKTISSHRAEFMPPDDSLFVQQSPRSLEAAYKRLRSIRDFNFRQSEPPPAASPVSPQIEKANRTTHLVAASRDDQAPQKSSNATSNLIAPNTNDQKQQAQEAPTHSTPPTSIRNPEIQAVLPPARRQPPLDQTTQRAVSRSQQPTAQPVKQTIESPETQTSRVVASPTIIAQPHVAAYTEPKAFPVQQASAATEPQPVINVTIGRVEVRATASQSPIKQSSRAQSPVMSLDEYLRQRREGER